MSTVSDQQLQAYIDQVFQQFDRDGSQSLDVNELANFFNAVFQRMGDPTRVSQQDAQQIFASIDTNRDGRCAKMELFTVFKAVLARK